MQPRKASLALLNHMRWAAALAVVLCHIRENLFLDHAQNPNAGIAGDVVYFLGAYGHAGVVVFFALSGFLVGGKALDLLASPTVSCDWRHFFIDRFSRIFIVLWPALAVAALVFVSLQRSVPNAPFMTLPHWGWAMQYPLNGDAPLKRWAGNAALFNGFGASTVRVDAPLWSLAYEWLYYMVALASVLVIRRVFSRSAIVVIIYATALLVLSIIFTPDMLYLGLVWVMGLVARLVFDKQIIKGGLLQYGALALMLGLLAIDRFFAVSDLLLGLSVASVIAHHGWSNWRHGTGWGAKLADFSYSFYMVHYPVIVSVMAILFKVGKLHSRLSFHAENLAIGFAVLGFAFIFARGFAWLTEDRTGNLRSYLLRLFQIPNLRPVAVLAAD